MTDILRYIKDALAHEAKLEAVKTKDFEIVKVTPSFEKKPFNFFMDLVPDETAPENCGVSVVNFPKPFSLCDKKGRLTQAVIGKPECLCLMIEKRKRKYGIDAIDLALDAFKLKPFTYYMDVKE